MGVGGLSSLSRLPLPPYPLPDIRSAVQQPDALCFAGNEEAHNADVHERHLVQVEHEPRAVPPDLRLELLQILRLDATDEPQRGGLAVESRLDPEGQRPDPVVGKILVRPKGELVDLQGLDLGLEGLARNA